MHFLRLTVIFPAIVILAACATPPAPQVSREPFPSAAERFFQRYADLAGHAYAGESVMVDLGEDNPLEGADLLMIPEQATDDEVRIRFFVNDDQSRTWIIRRTENNLHLSHDHRHADGSEYPQNLYGGYSDEQGTSTKQFFPADERTIEERPAREINVWSKEFVPEENAYYYRLYLRGDLRYEAKFDLSEPLPLPET